MLTVSNKKSVIGRIMTAEQAMLREKKDATVLCYSQGYSRYDQSIGYGRHWDVAPAGRNGTRRTLPEYVFN